MFAFVTVVAPACSSQMSEIRNESSWPPPSALPQDEAEFPPAPHSETLVEHEAPEGLQGHSELEVALANVIGFPFRGVGWLVTQIF
jgi:hypothetical protein